MKIKLELREESWKNLFYNIREHRDAPTGNFWTAIQCLEEQLELCLKQDKEDIDLTVPENQTSLEFNQSKE